MEEEKKPIKKMKNGRRRERGRENTNDEEKRGKEREVNYVQEGEEKENLWRVPRKRRKKRKRKR